MKSDRREFVESMKKRLLIYSKSIVLLADSTPWKDISGQILVKQLLRSGTSIAANYIEAQGAPTKKDFTNFLSISLKFANETIFWLDLFLECQKGDRDRVILLRAETVEF